MLMFSGTVWESEKQDSALSFPSKHGITVPFSLFLSSLGENRFFFFFLQRLLRVTSLRSGTSGRSDDGRSSDGYSWRPKGLSSGVRVIQPQMNLCW